MRKQHWPKRDPIKNYFPLPNEIFSLGLSAGAIAVYGFLLHREDRRTYQCVASYRTIGEAVGMSVNTGGGDERQHSAQVCDRAGGPGADPDGAHHRHHPGRPHPQRLSALLHPAHPDVHRTVGCLRYYILPIQMSIEQFYARQLHAADLALERQRAERRMAALKRKECASGC